MHWTRIFTEEREEGEREGVSGVLVLEVRDDAENLGGRGAREKPLGYAGAELERMRYHFHGQFQFHQPPSGRSDLGGFSFGPPPNCTLWGGRLAWEGGGRGHQAPASILIPTTSLPVFQPLLQTLRNLLPFLLGYHLLV